MPESEWIEGAEGPLAEDEWAYFCDQIHSAVVENFRCEVEFAHGTNDQQLSNPGD